MRHDREKETKKVFKREIFTAILRILNISFMLQCYCHVCVCIESGWKVKLYFYDHLFNVVDSSQPLSLPHTRTLFFN
jgi:hypothetical protein